MQMRQPAAPIKFATFCFNVFYFIFFRLHYWSIYCLWQEETLINIGKGSAGRVTNALRSNNSIEEVDQMTDECFVFFWDVAACQQNVTSRNTGLYRIMNNLRIVQACSRTNECGVWQMGASGPNHCETKSQCFICTVVCMRYSLFWCWYYRLMDIKKLGLRVVAEESHVVT